MNCKMKHLILGFVLFFAVSRNTFAQKKQFAYDHRDALKVNLVSPLVSLYSAQYEKNLTRGVSFLLTGFYRPQKNIPFGTQLDNVAKNRGLGITGVDFQYIYVDKAQIGVKGISPELRFYLGKSKNRAFVSIFGQYEAYNMNVPASLLVNYRGQDNEVESPIDFVINTLSGGALIGKQFRFGERFGVDIVLIGAHFGKANRVDATVNQGLLAMLSEDEKAVLKQRIVERFKLDETYYDTAVGSDKATVTAKRQVPYFGIRGAGVNLSYYF